MINYLLIPFSIVSNTNVDASCKYVLVLADEKPEIADDSEIEDRLEWSSVGTTIFGPIYIYIIMVFVYFVCSFVCINDLK